MTTDALRLAAKAYSEGHHFYPGQTIEAFYDATARAFIAGAEWMREQPLCTAPVRLVPRIGPGAVRYLGLDLASPGSDCTTVSVGMTKDTWDAHCKQMEDLREALSDCQKNREDWRQQVGKLESQIATLKHTHQTTMGATINDKDAKISRLQERNDGLACDVDKARAERDDWHQAHDKLVSDLLHGRKRVFNVKVSAEDQAEINKAADVREFVPMDESGASAGFGVSDGPAPEPAVEACSDKELERAILEALRDAWNSGLRFGRLFP